MEVAYVNDDMVPLCVVYKANLSLPNDMGKKTTSG